MEEDKHLKNTKVEENQNQVKSGNSKTDSSQKVKSTPPKSKAKPAKKEGKSAKKEGKPDKVERKRTRAEERAYKKLQEEIASLPSPSFNVEEKAQPTKAVGVPSIVPAIISTNKTNVFEDEKPLSMTDTSIILDSNLKRIESVAHIKKSKPSSTILRTLGYLKKYWYLILLVLLFSIINSVFEIFIPLIIGDAIDYIIGAGNVDFGKIGEYVVYLIICIICFPVFRWLLLRVANGMSYRVEQNLHNDLFKKFNKVPLKYIDNTSHGDLQSRMVNDVDLITDGFVLGLTTFFDCLVTIVLTMVFMVRINVTMAVVIICATPLSIVIAGIITKLTHKLFKKKAKSMGDLSGTMAEYVGNQKVVKSFLYEGRSIEKFDEINKKLRDSSEKATFYSSLSGPVSRFTNGLLYATVAIIGCIFALKGNITIGGISVLLTFANKYSKPFNEIADVFADLQSAVVSAGRVFNVLDMKNETSDEDLPELLECTGEVDFCNVDFSYTKDKKLLQNLNLNVKNGQKVAIVGPTGCGKSTLINLLMRFYDVDKGAIIVSDCDIRNVKRKSLRKQFGMVLQETWLFSASIRDNIAYSKPDATDKEVRNCAKLAGIDYFISTLPNGYDTIITENGDNLSQGQKQLICIARLFLASPPMLILDEATSNIDTRTELAIQQAFDKIMSNKTSFIVAHRLSTIASADIILVMNKGNIIEQGTHKQLLSQKGFYYNLYNSQFSRY